MTTAATVYRRPSRTRAVTSGGLGTRSLFIHDGAVWEDFSAEDLQEYLEEGVAKAAVHIARIADVRRPFTERDEEQMLFMVEALLHARHAFEESPPA